MRCLQFTACCLLLVGIQRGLGAEIGNKSQSKGGDCSARLQACLANEKSRKRQQVCGTDNKTYQSRCQLLTAKCAGTPVGVKHQGKCREVQPCWADLSLSQRQSRQKSPSVRPSFDPVCLQDGTYASVQCGADTGRCWCVKPNGQPLPNTAVQYGKPNCPRRLDKSGPRRRSSPRGDKKSKVSDCGRMDRTLFNNNLIHIFKNEYSRLALPLSNSDTVKASDLDRAVLEWKFSSIDVDGDNYLVKEEYRDLRRLVRKVVKPKRCARTFASMCDMDADDRVSREEWVACLGHDFNLQQSVTGVDVDVERRRHLDVLQSKNVGQLMSGHLAGFTELPVERVAEQEAAADCMTDRRGVLDEQKTGNGELYVPECKEDGRYNQIQCYKSTGYCWCVHEDSGKPIPGTSVKDQDPKCDSIASPSRPMNGCPEPRKQEFLTELMDFLMKKMMAANNKTLPGSEKLTIRADADATRKMTPEEHTAKWNFLALDKNKNKVLEKKEWKSLRTLVAANRQLRRCGQRLPRYCDVNHDRKISMTEWLNCLNPERNNSPTSRATTVPSRRRGLNPLEIYLNGDD